MRIPIILLVFKPDKNARAIRYLRSLTFAIYKKGENENTDCLLETYTFSFEYPANGPPTLNGQPMDRDNVRQQAISFIRCLVEFSGTLDQLPEERWLTMKLSVR